MIRRSPTRIELKLDDIQEFDYVQKLDKKKNPPLGEAGNLSAASAAKLLRHERIGYHRTTGPTAARSGSGFYTPNNNNCLSARGGDGGDTATTSQQSAATSSSSTITAITGVTSTSTPNPVTGEAGVSTDTTTPGTSNLDPANLPSDIVAAETNDIELIEFNSTYVSANMNMSMDET